MTHFHGSIFWIHPQQIVILTSIWKADQIHWTNLWLLRELPYGTYIMVNSQISECDHLVVYTSMWKCEYCTGFTFMLTSTGARHKSSMAYRLRHFHMEVHYYLCPVALVFLCLVPMQVKIKVESVHHSSSIWKCKPPSGQTLAFLEPLPYGI